MSYDKGRPRKGAILFTQKPELLTDPVFLIGNGKSRENFDLNRLRGKGTIIGCNALYRDFSPDILIAIDAKMLKELHEDGYCDTNNCLIPHNRTVKVPKATTWRTDRFNTSGCFAIKMISELMNPQYCFMLGMDAYPGNVYDKTRNYSENTLQNFKGINTYYLRALNGPGDTIFVNVNNKDSWDPEVYDTGRYKFISYSDFEIILNGI